MKKRKTRRARMQFAPPDRDLSSGLKSSLEEACAFLQRYLNDEFELFNDRILRGNKNPGGGAVFPLKNFAALNDVQALMMSARVIGERVIHKYGKGKEPHFMRVAIWKKGLKIAERLESENRIISLGSRKYLYNDLVFTCRVYDVEDMGKIFIPESDPCPLMDWETGDSPNFTEMPELLYNSSQLKKYAAKIISELDFSIFAQSLL